MKKLCLVALVAVFSITSMNAQDIRFGATAGYLNLTAKAKVSSVSVSSSESGFYGGVFAEFSLSDEFKLQPELLYASVDGSDFLQIPVMAKYYVAEKINVQGGLQFNYSLEETGDDFSALGFGLGLGAGYDITDDILVTARYAFQLNDNYTGDGDFSSKINFFNIGLGYRF